MFEDIFVKEGSERRVCGARWIPDRHLTVKLLESPENEDGYMSVHFAFPIPAGSPLLFLSSRPPFLVFLLLFLFFLMRLRLLLCASSFPPLVVVRIRLERKKRDLRSARVGMQAMSALLLLPLLMVPVPLPRRAKREA